MNLFGGVIPVTGISFLMFCVFGILFLGYAFGRITIKGVSLGDAGVFIVALIFGALFFTMNDTGLVFSGSTKPYDFESGLSLIESLGLVLFVTSVGFIAGPKFFGNFKKNFKSYVLLGVIVILSGALAAAACIGLGEVIGYPGKWSSYPPHWHPQPEIYFYKFNPENGYGFAELGEDVVKTHQNSTVFITEKETHPQTTAPGYALWYLWVIRHLDGDPYITPTFVPEHLWVTESENEAKMWPPIK
jgi:hypothetical protein